ncbi:MAG TPA: ATP-dependent RecD-like DNA helicase [Polyangia bacterium]|jgi:exodeoxyribonuclease V alpha subunit|nr:ATP-dependent RecD-like DNA helicase [Polyangia bacterium]
MSAADESETIDAVLERMRYVHEESAWTVAEVSVPGRREPITVVGNLLGVQPGENLRLRGRWEQDRKYGQQFRVASFMPIKPATLAGIEKYLGSGLVQGIGRALAARLVRHFQLETLEVLEHHSERLTEVEGIGPVRSRRIREAWLEQRDIQEVMIFLQSHGVSPSYAVRIFKTYGRRAMAVVRENPYQLALDVFGIGFRIADRIAAEIGIPRDSPQRAAAGALHALSEITDEGHCYFPRAALVERATDLLDVPPELVETALDTLAAAGRIVIEPLGAPVPDPHEPLGTPDHGQAVYLASLYNAERGAAAQLRTLLDIPARPIRIDPLRAVAWFEEQQGITLAPEQRAAITRAITSKLLVITGGPGTGKTTIINGIIRILEKKERRILLCAPTGRAAKRMQQATGRDARTAHRLLEFSAQERRFQRDREHPLEADVLIVDEVSMVDVVLLYHLLKAVPDAAQLILVGDVDQLPSVGPGSVLRDVIDSGAADVVRLQHIFRQAEASHIVVNAHRINAGEMPEFGGGRPSAPANAGEDTAPDEPARDFYIIERDDPAAIVATIKQLVAQRIPQRFGHQSVDDIQILTPMQRGALGVVQLNAELQALLNPAAPTADGTARELVRGSRVFREGDKVMQVINNYDLEVFNGDIGRIARIDPEERLALVRFDDREVTYQLADLDELVLAYACSIHKSQGSEYPAVVVPLHTQHYVMLRRNLLYTAVTRGKKLVVLVGSRKAVSLAIKTERVEARYSRLAERLRAGELS